MKGESRHRVWFIATNISDPGNPEPLPISTLPKHATMQRRLMRIGIDIDNVQMVTTDDGGRILVQYQEFVEVFSKKKAETLPPYM